MGLLTLALGIYLGGHPTTLPDPVRDVLVQDSDGEIYDEAVVHERHRHRYEVNNLYRDQLVEHGLVVSGTFQQGRLVEIVELPDHPWFVASQFHPEFKSRPTRPAPLFREFVVAALERNHARSGVRATAA